MQQNYKGIAHQKWTKIFNIQNDDGQDVILTGGMIREEKKSIQFWLKIVGACIICLIILVGVLLISVSRDPEPAALFADNVLRPLFGDKTVIALEGIVFTVQDKINHVTKQAPSKSSYSVAINTVAPLPALNPPQNITPFVDTANPLPGEGIWERISGKDLFTTFIRTDPNRPYSVVNLVYIPMKNIFITSVAGQKYPGGAFGKPGSGVIPLTIQKTKTVISVFNGGFQEKDGHYGMYSDGVTYVPLKKDLATLFVYKNGSIALLPYNGQELMPDVISARQNGPFLVKDGRTTKQTSEGIDLWAGTASGGYITWRSGIGVTVHGDIIYAAGPSLTPTSLADALRLAGSKNAMQLDINAFWVRFFLYTWDEKAKTYSSKPLVEGMPNDGQTYLKGNEKDFFYLTKKQLQ